MKKPTPISKRMVGGVLLWVFFLAGTSMFFSHRRIQDVPRRSLSRTLNEEKHDDSTTTASLENNSNNVIETPSFSIPSSTAGISLKVNPGAIGKADVANQTKIQRLESRANSLLRDIDREGLPRPSEGIKNVHYRVSRFQLSLGYSSTVHFSVKNSKSPGKFLNEDLYHNVTDQISCPMSHRFIRQIAHFAQTALPCWSALQRFPRAQRFIELHGRRAEQGWTADLLRAFESDGITILDNDGRSKANFSPEWKISMDQASDGWQAKRGDDSYFEQGNPAYFFNRSDVQSLQKRVLRERFRSDHNLSLPLRVLLVQRRGYEREWINAQETADRIESTWGTDLVEARYLPNPWGSLQNQSSDFHEADIIVSPHGAQLVNLAFIRPCTSVLELFPAQYYLTFYQPFVLSAGGISYEGYPFEREPLHDSVNTGTKAKLRRRARAKQMLASTESILRALPRLVLSTLSCRRTP